MPPQIPLPPPSAIADPELLTVAEMGRADAAAVAAGVPSLALMEAAGHAVARAIRLRWRPRRVVILCGPGNNGGDGFVIARRLARDGWPVRVALLGERDRLGGDAAVNAARWDGPIAPLDLGALDRADLVVDALFGAGLTRPVEGVAGSVLEAVAARGIPSVAVDMPSGVDGDTGRVLGTAAPAAVTVTFFRAKPGHLLDPGGTLCGDLVVSDIGIPAAVLADIRPMAFRNGPALWTPPRPRPSDHKYTRGHAVVFGGARMTGAGRLAARAARRMGAGLLSVAAPEAVLPLYAQDAPGVITRALERPEDLDALLDDARHNALLLGPGSGRGPVTAQRALALLATGRPTVLDADALTSFADDPGMLFEAIIGPVVLTPHEGEFRALFPDLASEADRAARARLAARRAGAVVLLKGPRTLIAAPDGHLVINADAPPSLATAGSGDVLAGAILGLLAQGMPAAQAAAAAVWLHGAGARLGPPGLIAEDLPDAMAEAMARLATPASPGPAPALS
ncbi:NAD(P)H-hydrate dehydratase [Roseospira visakhapatnamensis]|uniref:Bifunctional NAD(P)H-hydrate repair enzyme n=1 Tax=Roseospira visakhapatnamensis TaxID=390880 RepID=A0A7W6WAB7_9PROT|nr:NAD(P)H-hydrate dehydratase [Roseospira visakhapatnamensis]MBB4266312.1 NAD(P)H-hydrate epimerase [Roseospira visakhapatnamensis]